MYIQINSPCNDLFCRNPKKYKEFNRIVLAESTTRINEFGWHTRASSQKICFHHTRASSQSDMFPYLFIPIYKLLFMIFPLIKDQSLTYLTIVYKDLKDISTFSKFYWEYPYILYIIENHLKSRNIKFGLIKK